MAIVSDLSPISLAQFFYQSGKLVRPARLFFFKPNTEDPYTVYTDPTLGIPYEQPVLTGGSGRVPPIYIGADPYRIRVFDSYGSMIEDIDYLPGASGATEDGGGGGEPGTPGTVLQTGDIFFAFAAAATPRTGCVRANGGLIGNTGFDSTGYPGEVERRNADTHDLFVWLWGQDGVLACPVIPSKGVSAADDWVANKGIRLPDARGSALIGLDGMGMVLAESIPPLAVGHPAPGVTDHSGAWGGNGFTTMTTAQMPAHAHTVNANTTGVTINKAVTGVTTQALTTGLTINPNNTGISIQGKNTGITVAANHVGGYLTQSSHTHTYFDNIPDRRVVRLPAELGDDDFIEVTLLVEGPTPRIEGTTGPAVANVVWNDPWHAHGLNDPWHFHGVNESPHYHAVSEPAHAHNIIEPSSGTGHSHTITEPGGGHSHTTVTVGGGTPMTTISPFLTVMVYIKL